ncbi:NAD(P)-binding protein [Hymenopellis radicata]|nr:NAD(P)-binding protein [Hymenopellis radicata]
MSPGNVYLVLGGEDHIGRHIVQRLHSRGDVVSSFGREQKNDDVPFYPGDVCIKADISKAIKLSGATCIFHCISPLSTKNRDNLPIFHKVNVEGTHNVIEAALEAGVAKLIYHSSSGVTPFDPYTVSKAMAEQAVLAANGKNDMRTVSIRPAGLFGVGDRELMAGCYDAVQRGMSHVQLGGNKNIFDRTYIGNVALGHVLAADKLDDPSVVARVAGEAFTITNDDPMPFWDFQNDFYDAIYKTFPGLPPRKKTFVIPKMLALFMASVMRFMAWIAGKREETFTRNTVTFATSAMVFSCGKAKAILGYKPEVTVQEGIQLTMQWWKSEVDAGRA